MNPARRARLAQGARQTALMLDWEAELDRLDASYRSVLGWTAREDVRSDIFDRSAATSAAT
jgi:hypothetical protein